MIIGMLLQKKFTTFSLRAAIRNMIAGLDDLSTCAACKLANETVQNGSEPT